MRIIVFFASALTFFSPCRNEPSGTSAIPALPPRGAINLDTIGPLSNLDTLDVIYQSAVHVDSARAFFKTEAAQDAWMRHWQTMLYALGDSLVAHNIAWNQKFRIFSRVYFNENGGIDHYLYSIKETSPGYPNPALRDSLRTLLKSFAETYRMDTVIGGKVAQCGPVSLLPPE